MFKNEAQKDIHLYNYLSKKRKFSQIWETKKSNNNNLQELLKKTSKKNNGERGEPDFIYINENKKLLILIENKDSIKDHISENQDKPQFYAVDGIRHYLKFFTKNYLENENENIQNYFKNWKILGLAVSGDIQDHYSHNISSFIIKNGKIENINNNNLLNEEEYLALFDNIDIEKIISKISKLSQDINDKLRNMDSQKRPVILSSLLICLFDRIKNDFRDNFISYNPKTIIHNIPITIENILNHEDVPQDKIEIIKNQFEYAIKDDLDIAEKDILKDILKELNENVIPIFKTKTNYDIIGKFYENFLKYAGVTNVKNGIVLTPRHITELFTELIDIKLNDVIFDPCCGTGAFLIAGMNKIIKEIENSKISNKQETKQQVKQNQLIGFEKNPTMFALSISNMLFRGDGKSQIHHIDFFDKNVDKILENLSIKKGIKPTIGFINPPYGGLNNEKNPTKKEIEFLIKLLDSCSRYVIIIAPLSTYFKEELSRNKILVKHTLKYVINMPNELFQPNASSHTAIAVFETNTPHKNKEILLYNLQDDGFVLSKQKGRTDVYKKWDNIKKDLLYKIDNQFVDGINFVKTQIKKNDEWIIQAHSKTDYSNLQEEDFLNSIREYIIFKTKKNLNILDKDLNELQFREILENNSIYNEKLSNKEFKLNKENWELFKIKDSFKIRGSKKSFTKQEIIQGNYLYITTSNKNNGFSGTSHIWTEKGNVITFDSATEGKCFYQENNFIASDHVEIIEPINFKLNKYLGIFFVTILNMELPRYSFGRKRAQKRMKNDNIYLPYKIENGQKQPDFEFMENYIKSLAYSKYL